MTDDQLEQALRESLQTRAAVRDDDVRPLRDSITTLPPRRVRRRREVLAAAAGIVVMFGLGGVLVGNLPLGSGGAAPDSRLAVCGVTADEAEATVVLEHVRDYPHHFPAAYPLIGLQADLEAPALVVVLAGPASGDRAGNSPGAGHHDLCMVVGTGEQPWQRVDLVDVDTTGLIAVLPEGTPFADALAPWAERCGGADARIRDVHTFDRGTDIATSLALDPSPPELDTDEPGAVIVYADGHPFPPIGTPPAGGATVAPRDPLAPGHHDLCVLVGADPATATRTLHENVAVAPAVTPPPAPDATPLPRTFPLAVTDGCDTLGVDNPVTGTLHGDPSDPELVWLQPPGGGRLTIVWPAGFGVVFEPRLRLLASDGSLVANEGDTVVLQVPRAAAAGTPGDPYVADGIMLAGPDIARDLNTAAFQGCFHERVDTVRPQPSAPAFEIPSAIDPADCRTMRFTDSRCVAVVERALAEAGLTWDIVESVSVSPIGDRPDVNLGGPPVASVEFLLPDGAIRTQDVRCAGAFGADYDPVCTDAPLLRFGSPYSGGGYRDVPCGSDAADNPTDCATPLPEITREAARDAVPLEVAARDIPITSTGPMEIDMGMARLPNGIVSEGRFTLADPRTQAFRVAEVIEMVIRSHDPSRPPFDSYYEHGWYPGTEDVEVYLVLDVTSFTPGAKLEVRDLVVR